MHGTGIKITDVSVYLIVTIYGL
jgi:hypothetical protein